MPKNSKQKKDGKPVCKTKQSLSIGDVQQAYAQGDLEQSAKLVKTLLQGKPNDVNALYLQGVIHMQSKRLADAVKSLRKALRLQPKNPDVLNMLATVLFANGEHDECEVLLRRAIAIDSRNMDAVGNLGLLLQHIGKPTDALKYLAAAAKQPKVHTNIVEAWIKEASLLGRNSEVAAAMPRLIVEHPNSIYLHCINASLLEDSGKIQAAENAWKKAQSLDFSSPEIRIMRGSRQITSGDINAARKNIDAALAINPHHSNALFSWALGFARYEKDDSIRERILGHIKESLKRPDITFVDWSTLHFAAGTIADAMKQYDEAFRYYDAANKAIWERYDVSKDIYIAAAAEIMDVFTPDLFESKQDIVNRAPSGDDRLGEGLIFIACMPRSGTTLTEQILSRGGLVKAGGERSEIENMTLAAAQTVIDGNISSIDIKDVTLERIREIASLHHRHIDKISNKIPGFSDKTPRNYYHFGLLYLLFPKAKFINCVRNPMDTCLSCYFNYFQWNSVVYTYDLETLGVYYRTYEILMKYWRETLPIDIYDVVYEDLTDTPEEKIRELVTFCDLPWDEAYLTTDKGNRVVKTASAAQVRQPMYRSSIERWKPYEKHLLPLLKALDADYTQFVKDH